MTKIELLPIFWFGNKPEYLKSNLKIITVGLNPSDKEFRLNKNDPYSLLRFPNFKGPDTLDSVLNDYFEKLPYSFWFNGGFESILNGMESSYYAKSKKPNRTLHSDICSPWATNPTWKDLSRHEKEKLYSEGHPQWNNLIKELKPDVILISVAKNHLTPDFKRWGNWAIISKDKKGNNRNDYAIEKYYYELNGFRFPVVFGRAAQMPFGLLSKNQKIELGKLIYEQLIPNTRIN
jgi:hypothetical protein